MRKQEVAFLKKSSAKDFLLILVSGRFSTARSGAEVFWLLPIESPKKRFYPQISQINADFGANAVCVNLRNLRINACVDKARTADGMKKSWMPAFAGMTRWCGRGWAAP